MQYGTKVNQEIHKEVIEKINKLDMPKVIGFITPILIEKDNDIMIEQADNFFNQQLDLL